MCEIRGVPGIRHVFDRHFGDINTKQLSLKYIGIHTTKQDSSAPLEGAGNLESEFKQGDSTLKSRIIIRSTAVPRTSEAA